jgi:predicted transcriptional regulator of viral defense system
MPRYLKEFNEKLKDLEGSLVKVKSVKNIAPNAKEYLNKLAAEGYIKRVKWGWYWIPTEITDVWNFLEKDKNFKVVSGQTAASFWNNDFVHRDIYVLKVKDKSYGKALEEFGKKKRWNFKVEYSKDASKIKYTKIGNLLVEDMEENIIECLQNWAFSDAFATLYENRDKINLERLYRESYWKRISKTNVRAKQALEYGFHHLEELGGAKFPHRETKFEDNFVKREIDEAIEKVVLLG